MDRQTDGQTDRWTDKQTEDSMFKIVQGFIVMEYYINEVVKFVERFKSKKKFRINISFRMNRKQKQYTLTRQAPASMAPRHSAELHSAYITTHI
jgi:hypothetical protein